MRNFLMQLVPRTTIMNLEMIRVSYALEKLIPTQNLSLRDQILLTWMKMRKKCFQKHELGWQTQGVKRLKEKPEKSSLRRQGGLLLCRKGENSRLQVLISGKGREKGKE
uniref:Uncharacterized protein n=1 Tax=Opuntia streptacantha TaxID=393608 RepID=A0A7C9CVZ5_OPUST